MSLLDTLDCYLLGDIYELVHHTMYPIVLQEMLKHTDYWIKYNEWEKGINGNFAHDMSYMRGPSYWQRINHPEHDYHSIQNHELTCIVIKLSSRNDIRGYYKGNRGPIPYRLAISGEGIH